jgi:hypothetical protein
LHVLGIAQVQVPVVRAGDGDSVHVGVNGKGKWQGDKRKKMMGNTEK